MEIKSDLVTGSVMIVAMAL